METIRFREFDNSARATEQDLKDKYGEIDNGNRS
jgi:hypothetical protein